MTNTVDSAWLHRGLTVATILAAGISPLSPAFATSFATHFVSVSFERGGVALPATARQRLHAEIAALPHGGWCPGVLVTASVSSALDPMTQAPEAKRRNQQRLRYVLRLLEIDGVPTELVLQSIDTTEYGRTKGEDPPAAMVVMGFTGPLNFEARCAG